MDRSALTRSVLRTLGRNKLRTALTLLGITIAISAVICTVAIGEGGSRLIQQSLMQLGENLVWIEAGGRHVAGVRTGTGTTKTLRMEDQRAILRSVPLIKSCSPMVDSRIQVIYSNQNWNTTYRGVSPEFLEVRRLAVASGTMFSEEDVENYANVCLLGPTVVRILFGNEDPIGKTIRIRTLPLKVIGVVEAKGVSATGQDQDDFLLLPYTTAQNKVKGIDWLDDIMCSAISTDAIRPALDQITLLLRERHRLQPGVEDDFNIRTPEDHLKVLQDSNRTFTLMLAGIASVSLLVGGIGVMNIMLVSVTERTREIGVRLAVGATEMDVQTQFLMEAVALSLLGGAIGVPAGILSSMGVSAVLGWPTAVPPSAILTAFLFAVGVGIFFGFYPAQKAARLDPIEALRYE